MLVVRPIQREDLDSLFELTTMTSYGLTTLPRDRELLRRKIVRSMRSFEDLPNKPGGELYMFVMVDTETNLLVGTSSIVSKTGGFEPFYAYKVESEIKESQRLNVRKEIQTLHLVREHDGPSEIGSLFLRPSHRRSGNGRLLSLSRFLFVAEHPTSFEHEVIAEMRGVIDERGQSDFWDALGRRFFDIDFPDADYLSIVNKDFIAELMPKHPIYVELLPTHAREVIGQVHERTRPALRLLETEGFKHNDMIDIFEAGPMVRCDRDSIRTVRDSVRATITALDADLAEERSFLICSNRDTFTACVGGVARGDDGTIAIAPEAAAALGVAQGDSVRFTTIRP